MGSIVSLVTLLIAVAVLWLRAKRVHRPWIRTLLLILALLLLLPALYEVFYIGAMDAVKGFIDGWKEN